MFMFQWLLILLTDWKDMREYRRGQILICVDTISYLTKYRRYTQIEDEEKKNHFFLTKWNE